MKKLNFIFLYLIIFQPYFANSEEEVNLKCTGKIKQINLISGMYEEDKVVSVIYNKKLKKILLDGFDIGGSDDGCEGFRDKNDYGPNYNPFYCDKESYTYSMCFDTPSNPELHCFDKRQDNSNLKRLISLKLDKVTTELFFTDIRRFIGDNQMDTFTGNCEKVDKLF